MIMWKYADLARELKTMWEIRIVMTPFTDGSVGTVSKEWRKTGGIWDRRENWDYDRKISNWKTQDYFGIHGSWFKRFTFIHDRLTLELNKIIQEASTVQWMTKGKTTLTQKTSQKIPFSENVDRYTFPYDVENTDCTDKRRNQLLTHMLWNFCGGIKRKPQWNEWNKWPTLHKTRNSQKS